jgi:mRNA-capping enzyme
MASTGFFIVSYLVLTNQACLEYGLSLFTAARPSGIYKQKYLVEIYRRYEDITNVPSPLSRPCWCADHIILNIEGLWNEHSGAENQNVQQARDSNYQHPLFFNFIDIPGITSVLDNEKLLRIQKRMQRIYTWDHAGFPDSQPYA